MRNLMLGTPRLSFVLRVVRGLAMPALLSLLLLLLTGLGAVRSIVFSTHEAVLNVRSSSNMLSL